jgi:hypothetical protein
MKSAYCIAAILSLWGMGTYSYAQSLVGIERTATSPIFVLNPISSINPLEGKVVQKSANIVLGQYLYLAFALHIDLAGMNYLRYHRQLPVYELWVSSDGPDLFNVGITEENWKIQHDKIEAEFRETGQVIWSTFGNKKNLTTAKYAVSLRDANNHPILLGDDIGLSEYIAVTIK